MATDGCRAPSADQATLSPQIERRKSRQTEIIPPPTVRFSNRYGFGDASVWASPVAVAARAELMRDDHHWLLQRTAAGAGRILWRRVDHRGDRIVGCRDDGQVAAPLVGDVNLC